MRSISYRFGTGAAEHLFCSVCGVKSFYQPRSHPDAWSVNANCLDEPCRADRGSIDSSNWKRRQDLPGKAEGRYGAISTRATSAVTARSMHRPLRLTIDRSALQANWRWLQDRAGVPRARRSRPTATGSARARRCRRCPRPAAATSSCRPGPRRTSSARLPGDDELVVLHGVGPDDVKAALATPARPVLNTIEQVAAVEGDRARPRVRRDDRHRHEPARAAARRDRPRSTA